MSKIVITSWPTYIDIDALTCVLVYADFMNKKWQEVYVNLSPNRWPTIDEDIKKLANILLKNIKTKNIEPDDKLILMDVSWRDYLQKHINLDQVIKIYDHHWWHEDFWTEKLWNNAIIQRIWSASTLIYEEIKSEQIESGKGENYLDKIEKESLELLYKCVVFHTFDTKAQVTHQRDLDSIHELKKTVKVDKKFVENYFQKMDETINEVIEKNLINETKWEKIVWVETVITQLELWDSLSFIEKNYDILIKFIKEFRNENWFFTCPSIKDWKNYLVTENENIKEILKKNIDAKFNWNIWETKILWLRKEILKKVNE